MEKVHLDTRLVQRVQLMATGADVHMVNGMLQRYYFHEYQVNQLIRSGELEAAEIEKAVFHEREKELRAWWVDKVAQKNR